MIASTLSWAKWWSKSSMKTQPASWITWSTFSGRRKNTQLSLINSKASSPKLLSRRKIRYIYRQRTKSSKLRQKWVDKKIIIFNDISYQLDYCFRLYFDSQKEEFVVQNMQSFIAYHEMKKNWQNFSKLGWRIVQTCQRIWKAFLIWIIRI